MLRRQEEMENGTAWSNSSESSDDSSSPQLSLGLRHSHKNVVQPEVQAAAPAIEISFAPRESATSTPTRLANQKEEVVEEEEEETVKVKASPVVTVTTTTTAAAAAASVDAGKTEVQNGHTRYSRSLSHISESSVDGALTDRTTSESAEPSEVASVASGISVNDIVMEMPVRTEPSTAAATTSQEVSTTSEPESSCNEALSSEELPIEQEDSEVCSLNTASEESRPASQPELPSEPSSVAEADSEISSKVFSEETQSVDSRTEGVSAQQGDPTASPRTESPAPEPEPEPEAMLVRAHVAVVEAEEEPEPVVEAKPTDSETESETVDIGLDEALTAVISSLDDYRGQFPELQVLEQELRLLEQALSVSP